MKKYVYRILCFYIIAALCLGVCSCGAGQGDGLVTDEIVTLDMNTEYRLAKDLPAGDGQRVKVVLLLGQSNETYTPEPEATEPPEEQPTPQQTPAVPAEPAPQPTEPPAAPTPEAEPTPSPAGGYAVCSCGAMLTTGELVPHMKAHAMNGENHSYRAY